MSINNVKKNATFRIEPYILKDLVSESNQRVMSLNSLVNQILRSYIRWEKQASKSGWIFMQKKVIKSIIEELDEKTISKIAVPLAVEVMTDTLLSMHGKVNLEGWIAVTKDRSEKSNFGFQEIRNNSKIQLIITHNMGLKWSIFHELYYKQMLHDLGYSATFDYTKNTLVVNIKL